MRVNRVVWAFRTNRRCCPEHRFLNRLTTHCPDFPRAAASTPLGGRGSKWRPAISPPRNLQFSRLTNTAQPARQRYLARAWKGWNNSLQSPRAASLKSAGRVPMRTLRVKRNPNKHDYPMTLPISDICFHFHPNKFMQPTDWFFSKFALFRNSCNQFCIFLGQDYNQGLWLITILVWHRELDHRPEFPRLQDIFLPHQD